MNRDALHILTDIIYDNIEELGDLEFSVTNMSTGLITTAKDSYIITLSAQTTVFSSHDGYCSIMIDIEPNNTVHVYQSFKLGINSIQLSDPEFETKFIAQIKSLFVVIRMANTKMSYYTSTDNTIYNYQTTNMPYGHTSDTTATISPYTWSIITP